MAVGAHAKSVAMEHQEESSSNSESQAQGHNVDQHMKDKNVYTPSVVPMNLWTAEAYGGTDTFSTVAEQVAYEFPSRQSKNSSRSVFPSAEIPTSSHRLSVKVQSSGKPPITPSSTSYRASEANKLTTRSEYLNGPGPFDNLPQARVV
jgi:hypothetical protein